MRVKLTAKTVENIRPPKSGRDQYWDAMLPGFGLRVTDKGRKSWVLICRPRGRQRRMTLGRYPAFSLAEAREEARKALRSVEQGNDPADEKLAAKRKPKEQFADIIDDFIEMYARPKNRSWKEAQRILKKNVSPRIGYMRIEDITRHHIIDILDEIMARGAPTQANRVLSHTRKLFNWALDRGMVDYSPVFGIKPPAKNISRDRVLTDNELKRLWPAWRDIGWPFGPLFKLLLITGQRRGEVSSMKWSDIDFERRSWTIPREIAKNDRTHEVPLPDVAMDIIHKIPRLKNQDYLFTTNGRTVVSGFSRAKRNADEKADVHDYRIHDLRRTAASGMARLAVPPHVVEKLLNHSSGIISGVAAVYNRYGYEIEKREALNTWAQQLSGILADTGGISDPDNTKNVYNAAASGQLIGSVQIR